MTGYWRPCFRCGCYYIVVVLSALTLEAVGGGTNRRHMCQGEAFFRRHRGADMCRLRPDDVPPAVRLDNVYACAASRSP
jgi:hypothetical protein